MQLFLSVTVRDRDSEEDSEEDSRGGDSEEDFEEDSWRRFRGGTSIKVSRSTRVRHHDVMEACDSVSDGGGDPVEAIP